MGAFFRAAGQGDGSKGIVVTAEVVNGDTFPMRYLPYVTIVEEKQHQHL